jgi:PhzF family phenazine biosynthesis protein
LALLRARPAWDITITMKRRFKQVDVFGARPFAGNPLAVVLDAEGLADADMQRIATWTNLSETTFLLPARAGGDYRVRIFTPRGELPFAGHPTIGTAHAFLESSGGRHERLVQECGAGLVPIAVSDAGTAGRRLAFQAPPVSLAALDAEGTGKLSAALGLGATGAGRPPMLADVGPRWVVFDLDDEAAVARLAPDMTALERASRALGITGVTVVGRFSAPPAQVRVRSFAPAAGVPEDPACGSGNVCAAAVLAQAGALAGLGARFTAVQGQEIQRDARLEVAVEGGGALPSDRVTITVGGAASTLVEGWIDA